MEYTLCRKIKVIATILLALIAAIGFAVLAAKPCVAQNISAAVGGNLNGGFGNISFGPSAIFDVNIPHNETIITGTFSPVEFHNALGKGYAYDGDIRNTIWIKRFGITGDFTKSAYSTRIFKSADYIRVGLSFHAPFIGSPASYYVEYLRQIKNGIGSTGTETSNVSGFSFKYDTTSGRMRITQAFAAGSIQEQGNPVCDGTFHRIITCPRTKAFSFDISTSVYYQWGK